MQKQWCLNTSFNDDEIIFKDEEVSLFITQVNKPRKKISSGKLVLTTTKLIFEEKEIELKDIIIDELFIIYVNNNVLVNKINENENK